MRSQRAISSPVVRAFQIVSGAGAGLLSTVGQQRAMAGRMSALLGIAATAPPILSNLGLCPAQAAAIAKDATLKPRLAKIGGSSVPSVPALPAPLSQSSLLSAAK